ncbi:MAG: TRAP transporter substrate-binding protein DctP [Proteobacteria bacterium]|jgi:TRAP-type C4-dicarboxylate transport system substrate-binding protein|nr:TRAP transporter substrate-binding protein DctP [Pseudomonadota bacterium]
MKRICMILLLAGTVLTAPGYGKTYKLATISPDGLAWMKQLRAGVRQIEEVTDGRVQFKIYPGGTMGDDITVLRKMRIGQLHGGVVTAGALTRFFPDLQVYNLPLTFQSYDEVDYVRQHMDITIKEGLGTSGFETFHLTETGFAYLLSKTPVTRVEDVRKLKAWIPDGDPIAADLIKTFGVSPIPLSITDVLPALQTGIIDAVAVPPLVALALQWHNHVKYMLDMPLMYIYSLLAMDGDAFARMSPEDAALTTALLNRVFEQVDEASRMDNNKAFVALAAQGIKVLKPAPGDLPAWRALADQSVDDLLESGQMTPAIVDTFNRHLSEFRAVPGTVAGDEEDIAVGADPAGPEDTASAAD